MNSNKGDIIVLKNVVEDVPYQALLIIRVVMMVIMVIRNDHDMKDTNTVAHTPGKTSKPISIVEKQL